MNETIYGNKSNSELKQILLTPNESSRSRHAAAVELGSRNTNEVVEMLEELYTRARGNRDLSSDILTAIVEMNNPNIAPLLFKILDGSGESEGSTGLISVKQLQKYLEAGTLSEEIKIRVIHHITKEEWIDVISVLKEMYIFMGSEIIDNLKPLYKHGQHKVPAKTSSMQYILQSVIEELGGTVDKHKSDKKDDRKGGWNPFRKRSPGNAES